MQFYKLSQFLNSLEETNSRIIIREKLKSFLTENFSQEIIYLLQNEYFRPYEAIEFNIGFNILIDAISIAFGHSTNKINFLFSKLGDLGLTAEKLSKNKKQQPLLTHKLTTQEVYTTFRKISLLSGQNSVETKQKYIASLLQNAKPISVKYIIVYWLRQE